MPKRAGQECGTCRFWDYTAPEGWKPEPDDIGRCAIRSENRTYDTARRRDYHCHEWCGIGEKTPSERIADALSDISRYALIYLEVRGIVRAADPHE